MAVSDKERDEFIMTCLNAGMSLNDVQNKLAEELGIRMTYMELRMLSCELQVSWEAQDKKAEAARPKSKPEPQNTPQQPTDLTQENSAEDAYAPENEADADDAQAPAADETNGTVVEVSRVVRPGCAYSGTVKFGSGASGEWFVDPQGRLGFEADEGSAKPTEADLRSFQPALMKALGY